MTFNVTMGDIRNVHNLLHTTKVGLCTAMLLMFHTLFKLMTCPKAHTAIMTCRKLQMNGN